MHWKIKSAIQNVIATLPNSVADETYYLVQRHLGGLRKPNPLSRLSAGIETCKRIIQQGQSPRDKTFLEIGTGRVPIVPLAFWLMGAQKVITIDINQYVKWELVAENLHYICCNQDLVVGMFGPLLQRDRLDKLISFSESGKRQFSSKAFFDLCQIEYIAPGNAAHLNVPSQSIDFHTSHAVLEHIPLGILTEILLEGNRVIRDNGLFIHKVDYSDHFSHSDRTISAINFLQYEDSEWSKFASNKYMYMNRLRHDDFIALFLAVGHKVVDETKELNQHAMELLQGNQLRLSQKFIHKSKETLSVTAAWIVTSYVNYA
jgi:hypothetical protein